MIREERKFLVRPLVLYLIAEEADYEDLILRCLLPLVEAGAGMMQRRTLNWFMTIADHHIGTLRSRCLAIALMLVLSGCAAEDIVATDSSGYVGDVEERVANIDWNKAETVDIALYEYDFAPSSLHFQNGHPYRLHLTNTGGEVHDFASKPFFRAIAVAELVAPDKTTPRPRLESIGLRAGETKDLYFVAVRPGTYPFRCREPLHATFGMTGMAEIE